MISIEESRRILGEWGKNATDEEIEDVRRLFYGLAKRLYKRDIKRVMAVGEGFSPSSYSPFPAPPQPHLLPKLRHSLPSLPSCEPEHPQPDHLDELATRQERQIQRTEAANARLEGEA